VHALVARGLARPVPELGEDTTVSDAIEVLRRRRASFAVVHDESGHLTVAITAGLTLIMAAATFYGGLRRRTAT
jgi:CBS domain-containing protein